MKATSSGVAFSAAKIRSPSFSRSSSSTTTTALPAARSVIARSILSKSLTGCLASTTIVLPGQCEVRSGQPFHVLRQDVHLKVDEVPRRPIAQCRERQRGRDQGNGEVVAGSSPARQQPPAPLVETFPPHLFRQPLRQREPGQADVVP